MSRISVLGCLLVMSLLVSGEVRAAPQAKLALVIANSAYGGKWPDLAGGPLRYAELMKKTLTQLGFELVCQPDAGLKGMKDALQSHRGNLPWWLRARPCGDASTSTGKVWVP
jgi:hypothetical protein